MRIPQRDAPVPLCSALPSGRQTNTLSGTSRSEGWGAVHPSLCLSVVDERTPTGMASYLMSTLCCVIREKDQLDVAVDWKPLYDLVDRVVFPGARAVLSRPDVGDEFSHRLRDLVTALRKNFPVHAPHEIIAEVRPAPLPSAAFA